MHVYSLNINHISDEVNSMKARTSLIDHFLNIARIDNIKHAKDRRL